MPRERQLGLKANLRRCHAQRRIVEGQANDMDYNDIYRLYLDAYGDEELATKARTASMKRLVRQETEAARLNR